MEKMKNLKVVNCMASGCFLTVIGALFGDVDYSFIFLCVMMLTDFLTGLMCGAYNHSLSSDVCIKGLMKKFMIFVYVMIGHHIDVLMGVNYVRIAVCYMYAVGEVLSIIENGVTLGLPVPEPIKKALDVINGGEQHD